MIVAWIMVLLGLSGGIGFIVAVSISEVRHKRRLEEMRREADQKRDNYFVLSDKIDYMPAPRRERRARFFP
jgi:hypothetical protein